MCDMGNPCGVYEIRHKDSNKRYIGSSQNILKRIKDHKRDLANNKHHSSRLQNSWNKYGEAAFEFSPILVCAPDNRVFYEQIIMDGYKVVDRNFGYNTRPKAESNYGHKFSEEFCKKQRFAKMGKPSGKKGKHYPHLQGRKLGPISEERKSKLRIALKGRLVWNKGIPLSEETKQKLSSSMKGVVSWNKGLSHTKEHIENMRKAKTGIKTGPYKSGNILKTHCPKGHPYSGDNLYIHPNANRRGCKICMKASKKRVGVL